jgi:hypothetical protein
MIILFQAPVDWSVVARSWGFTGVVAVVALLIAVGAAKWMRSLLTDTIADARKERDASRQLLKDQATQYLAHIKEENEEFRTSLRNVVDGFERGRKR